MGRLFGRIIVGFVVGLISFIAYSSQLFVIWPWYGRVLSVDLLVLLVPFNFLVGMIFWNYWLCVRTDPGRVPDSWQPRVEDSDGYEVKKLTGKPRFCRTCNKYKPPRAHHCRQCRQCVLRMDHHCPWVNNCIGHGNYGYFIRFLFFVDLASSYHLAMVTRRVHQGVGQGYFDSPPSVDLVFIVLNYTACIPVLLAVGGFSLYHFWLLISNSTTIEGWEKDKAAVLLRRGKIQEVKFPYDLGRRRNIASVLGKDALFWCIPRRAPGDGLKYEMADGVDPTSTPWPPRDPDYPVTDPNHVLTLPATPWTYANGSFNPNLQPSNTASPVRRRRPRVPGPASALPPYHPDYEDAQDGGPAVPAPAGAVDDGWTSSEGSSSGFSVAEDDGEDMNDDADADAATAASPVRVRRGSEGYEVRPLDREAMLRWYVEGHGTDAGRYRRYVPEPESGSDEGDGDRGEDEDGDGDGAEEDDEDVPLARRLPVAAAPA